MSGATCPACGVAILPGYVRCPKCRRTLPRRPGTVQGGTAVEEKRRWPLFAVLAAVAAAVLLGILVLGGDSDTPSRGPATQPATQTDQPAAPSTAPEPTFTDPQPTADRPTGPDPTTLAATLQQDLKRQRLCATVTVSGSRVDVRSGSCADPAMGPTLDGAAPGFKAAGLTKLRCVEQSGRVVSDRDL